MIIRASRQTDFLAGGNDFFSIAQSFFFLVKILKERAYFN